MNLPIIRNGAFGFAASAAVLLCAAACGDNTPSGRRPPAPTKCLDPLQVQATALPTEDWTAGWLSQWSEEGQRLLARESERNADFLIKGQFSMKDVPRWESSGDRFDSPPTLSDALALADELVVGEVTDQWLAWGTLGAGGTPVPFLLSDIRTRDGTKTISQSTSVACTTTKVTLGMNNRDPLLEVGVTYALITRDGGVDGTEAVIETHSFVVTGGELTRWRPSDAHAEPVLSLQDLSARFDAAHAHTLPQ